jgi:N-acetylneuraminic acid mutarotase
MKINNNIFYLFFSILFWGCNTAADSPYTAISFEKKSSMPGNGLASAVGFAVDGKGYVTLGRDSNGTFRKECWEYDPTLDTWTKKAPFRGDFARVKAVAVVLNGKAYIGLGYSGNGVYKESTYLKDFWMYDPKIDTWTEKDSFPSTFAIGNGYFVQNNTLYITCGTNGAGFNNEAWKFVADDEPTGNWVKINDFPGPARGVGVGCGNGEHFYFGTGYRTFIENDWWEYFPTTDSWKQRKSMPDNGRENAVALSVDKRIFVATGRHFGGNLTGGHLKSDILEYDIDRNVWFERGNIPAGERESAISFTIGGKGYIGFGENDSKVLNDFWSFEPGNQ